MNAVLVVLSLFAAISFSKPIEKDQSPPKPKMHFENARIFAPMKGSNATAGYAVISNDSEAPVTLILDSVESFGAVETHETKEKDGRMSMQKVDSLVIPAHGRFEFKPGAHHIMLFDPSNDLREGNTVKAKFKADGIELIEKFKIIPRVAPLIKK